MLTRWAYDDSTINKGYGLGFVWFLVRLTLATIFAVLDLLLSAVFLLAQVAYWFWGSTGRNVIWGLVTVPIFWLIVVGGWRIVRG